MKKTTQLLIISVMALTFIYQPVMAQTGPPWVKTTLPGFTMDILTKITFPGNQEVTGYIISQVKVMKTNDHGENWGQVWFGSNADLRGLCFLDVNNGYIAGFKTNTNGFKGIAKTTDGGTTWTNLQAGSDALYYTGIVFKDVDHGIVFGQRSGGVNAVWVTSDGGANWTLASGIIGLPEDACYISGNTYFLADYQGQIKKSVDNGLTWSTVYSTGVIFSGIDFYNETTGMACGGAAGQIFKTYDGGTTWEPQTVGGVGSWYDFGWENQQNVFVTGNNYRIFESADGGTNWFDGFQQPPENTSLYDCIFTSGGFGYIVGTRGVLLKRVPSCAAAFSVSSTAACAGTPVSFYNQSSANVTTFSWLFPGGTPSSSQSPNPVVTYDTPGTYDVQLIVSNGYWSDTLLQQNYITVNPTPAPPVITANGFLLESSAATGNQWYFNQMPIQGATGQTYLATQSGTYYAAVVQDGCESDSSNNIYLVMTGVEEQAKPDLTIFPVPASGSLMVSMDGIPEGRYTLTIYTNLGEEIWNHTIVTPGGKFEEPVDFGSAAGGVYLLVINGDHLQKTAKFLVKY